jgi:hypothetical protein
MVTGVAAPAAGIAAALVARAARPAAASADINSQIYTVTPADKPAGVFLFSLHPRTKEEPHPEFSDSRYGLIRKVWAI